jgi:hypothetical protein
LADGRFENRTAGSLSADCANGIHQNFVYGGGNFHGSIGSIVVA